MTRSVRLVFVLCCIVSTSWSGAALSQNKDISTFDSKGTTIAYCDHGKGVPVILLHGFSGRLSGWAPMRQALVEAGCRVIAMDARGHGQSDKPQEKCAYGRKMAEDVIHLLNHLKIAQAHVVGYSMGGDIANKVRELYPSRLSSVTMGGVGKGVSKGWTTSDFDLLKVAESLEDGKGIEVLLLEPGGAGRKKLSKKEIREMNKGFIEGQDQLALAGVIRAYPDLEVSEESLRRNTVPTLVVVGEYDAERPTVEELRGLMANLKIVIVPDADHFEAGEKPQLIRAVVDFVKMNSGKN